VYNRAPLPPGPRDVDALNQAINQRLFGVLTMKFKLPVHLAALALASFAAGAAQAQATGKGSAEAGQAKSATCVACHGVDGNSVNPEWPSIAGQHPTYIVKQLKAFKAGARQNALMSPMAQALSDQDMEDLAAFYASQTARGGEADKSKVEAGQKLYRGGNAASAVAACIACHGPNGRGNEPAGYPSIRGQHAKYVEMQLNAYKSGQRSTDLNKMMRDVAAKLTADEIAAVASYVQGLR
jgi:cytochrome c553